MARRRLPPLNGLRAFEVAVRHMSFKKAADELCITSTAVSHRIRALEEWLGVKLFNRLTRSLELTKEGKAYAPKIHDAFALLGDASELLKQSSEGGELVISTTMSFASNWLTPKLPRFYEQHDEFNLRVEGSDLLIDFTRSNTDVAIRYGVGDYQDLHSERLFADLVTPVCTPELASRVTAPQDLLALPRLDYQWAGFGDRDPSWEKWFRAAEVPDAKPEPTPVFSEEHMVLAQALAGHGVALIGITAAEEAISDGHLVRPIPIALENLHYFFVCPPDALHKHKVSAFRSWIMSEAQQFDQALRERSDLQFRKILKSDDL